MALTGTNAVSSLLFAILARPVAHGAWAGIAGMPQLGLEAAAGFGAPLDHLLLAPYPGDEWLAVVATMLDGCDLVAVSPTSMLRTSLARRIAARARERRSVLLVASPFGAGQRPFGAGQRPFGAGHVPAPMWSDAVDIHLRVEAGRWHGIDTGNGALRRRLVTVRSSGRRSSMLERSARLWLPAADGNVMLAGEERSAPRSDAEHERRSDIPVAPLAG